MSVGIISLLSTGFGENLNPQTEHLSAFALLPGPLLKKPIFLLSLFSFAVTLLHPPLTL
jgi:hypothetical protein